MSTTALLIMGALELLGLVGLFAWVRAEGRRREAGRPRRPRWMRISVALAGLLVVVGFPALMLFSMFNPMFQSERLHAKLVKTGAPATAVITHVDETGSMYNQRPEVRVRMTVQPPGAPAFFSQETRVFSVSDVQTYRVGTKVRVFFDPGDRGTVAVVGIAQ